MEIFFRISSTSGQALINANSWPTAHEVLVDWGDGTALDGPYDLTQVGAYHNLPAGPYNVQLRTSGTAFLAALQGDLDLSVGVSPAPFTLAYDPDQFSPAAWATGDPSSYVPPDPDPDPDPDPVVTFSYNPATPAGLVRLLLNDVDETNPVFTDAEIEAFLTAEGRVPKRAAALGIETNATNEALASKVLRDNEVSTDGAVLAHAMLRAADSLRSSAKAQARLDPDSDEGGYIGFSGGRSFRDVQGLGPFEPELTERGF